LAHDDYRRLGQVQPGDEYQVGEREAVRVPLQLDAHLADLAEGECRDPHPPGHTDGGAETWEIPDDHDEHRHRGGRHRRHEQRDAPGRPTPLVHLHHGFFL
jgi:hypothetical protein